MHQLHTLGALELTSPEGNSLDAILAQPKRSLFLAYLASATPRGYHRRDVLVALFWPELDAERARGALRKALHFLRATLGDVVITRGDEIAVDPARLGCDVIEFERAQAEGRLSDAMTLYRGDFLPGVFARDAPDVERWIQAERARLAALAARAAWTLAEGAEAHDTAAAARWASVAWSLAPDDEATLRRTMSLLDRVGERAAAFRAYDDFATALAVDFPGAEPSSATRDLRDRLLVRAGTAATISPAPVASPSVVEPGVTRPAPRAEVAPSGSRRGRWVAATALIACLALVAVAAMIQGMRPQLSDGLAHDANAIAARTVAVMPFTIRGGNIDYLREGMVDLLSIGLGGAGELNPVEPTALLGYLAHETGESDEVQRARAAARRFHAARFVLGTLVNAGGKLEARASLYDTDGSSETPISVATASADEVHVVALADELTRALVAAMLNSRELRLSQLAARTTKSLVALKSYLHGSQAMRTGQYAEARDAFQAAVTADSGFALAYYGLSMAKGWATGGGSHDATRAAEQAVRHARGLSQHDSLLLVAHYHNWSGKVVEAEREYRRLLAEYPTDVEAWHELGEVIFHGGSWSGHSLLDARDAFSHMNTPGPLQVSAFTHLARIAAVEHDSIALDSLVLQGQRAAPGDPRVAEIAMLRTFVSGDSVMRARAVASAAARSSRDVWSMARDLANYAAAWPEAEAVALLLTEPTRSIPVRALGWVTVAEIRAAAGRPIAARAAVVRAAAFDVDQAAYMRAQLASLPFLPASDAELASARRELALRSGPLSPFGDTTEPGAGAAEAAAVRRQFLTAIDVRSGRTPDRVQGDTVEDMRNGLQQLAVRAFLPRPGDMALARSHAKEIGARWNAAQVGVWPGSESLIRLARAELLHQIGNDDEAVHWYATFPAYGRNDAVFRAAAALGRARAAETLGDRNGAARAYGEVAWLWRGAEPELAARARVAAEQAASLRR